MKIIFTISSFFFIVNICLAQDTIPKQGVRVDTVVIEKVKVDTIYLPAKEPIQPQPQANKDKAPKQKENKKKLYFGGYASFSFGKYTVIGVEPVIAYKLLPKLSFGAKFSYEYLKNKNYSPAREGSNYGIGFFSRQRIGKRFYAHVEFSQMNYKMYDLVGDSYREWISFLYLGAGVRQPITKNTSFTFEVLWDLIQDDDSPYSTVEPFINIGIVAGF